MRAKVQRWNEGLVSGTFMLLVAGLASGLALAHVLPQ
jgi:hypothetical protein